MVILQYVLCLGKDKISGQSGAKGKPNISWSLGHKGLKTGPKKTAEIEPILCDADRKILCQRSCLPNDIRFNKIKITYESSNGLTRHSTLLEVQWLNIGARNPKV